MDIVSGSMRSVQFSSACVSSGEAAPGGTHLNHCPHPHLSRFPFNGNFGARAVNMRPKWVRIGTDCSGTDCPVWALGQCAAVKAGRLRISHRWSCDSDAFCRQFIELNHEPKIFYPNIIGRRVDQLPPIDIYVCGFPCQPFSPVGRREGFADCRSDVYEEVIRTLRRGSIRAFVLENSA
eukprot:9494633-Pyramimonas_sp.AAC.1